MLSLGPESHPSLSPKPACPPQIGCSHLSQRQKASHNSFLPLKTKPTVSVNNLTKGYPLVRRKESPNYSSQGHH